VAVAAALALGCARYATLSLSLSEKRRRRRGSIHRSTSISVDRVWGDSAAARTHSLLPPSDARVVARWTMAAILLLLVQSRVKS